MIKKYQNYIIKSFGINLIQVTIVFLSLIIVLNVFEEINFFKDGNVGFLYPLLLTLLNAPSLLFEIFPFIFLITTQFFFIRIIEKNELNIFKNYGLSNLKILTIITATSLILGILIIFLFYNFSSKLKFLYLELKNSYSSDNKYLAVVTDNGLWIKDEIDNKINIIHADRINDNFLIDVSIVVFSKNFKLIENMQSDKIDINNKVWIIENGNIFKNNSSPEQIKKFAFKSNFDLEKINHLFSNLSSLSLWDLQKLKKDYKTLGYSTIEIEFHSQRIYSYPFYLMIMSLIAGILMLNIKHNKSKAYYILIGILFSVMIYYINYFFGLLGKNEKIPVEISIWTPLLILTFMNFVGLVKINEK